MKTLKEVQYQKMVPIHFNFRESEIGAILVNLLKGKIQTRMVVWSLVVMFSFLQIVPTGWAATRPVPVDELQARSVPGSIDALANAPTPTKSAPVSQQVIGFVDSTAFQLNNSPLSPATGAVTPALAAVKNPIEKIVIGPTVEPNHIGPTVEPNHIGPTVEPNHIGPTVEPNHIGPTVEPNHIGPTVVPNHIGPTVEPNHIGPTIVPNHIGPTVVPNHIGPTVEPNHIGPTVVPNHIGPTVEPNHIGPTVVPNHIGPTIVPNHIGPSPVTNPIEKVIVGPSPRTNPIEKVVIGPSSVVPPAVQANLDALKKSLGNHFSVNAILQADGTYLVTVKFLETICDKNGLCSTMNGRSGLTEMKYKLSWDGILNKDSLKTTFWLDETGQKFEPNGGFLFEAMKFLKKGMNETETLAFLASKVTVMNVAADGAVTIRLPGPMFFKVVRDKEGNVRVLSPEQIGGSKGSVLLGKVLSEVKR